MRKLRSHLTYANVLSSLAALLVLTGGVAYAANTVGSNDIIDGQVKTPDLGANAVTSAKIADGQVTEADIGQAAVGGPELKNNAVNSAKVANESLLGADVQNNTLKGADIDESSLQGLGGGGGSLPAAQVVRDGTQSSLNTLAEGGLDPATDQVIQTSLPNGNWVVEANATFGPNSAVERNISCGLYDANNPLTEGNTHTQAGTIFSATMSLTGVSDGGIVRLACATDPPGAQVRDKNLVATRVGNVTGP